METLWGSAKETQQSGGLGLLILPPIVVAFALGLGLFPHRDTDPVEEREHAQGVEVAGTQALVLVAADVQNIVQAVFDAPFLAAGSVEGRRRQGLNGATGGQPHLGVTLVVLLGAMTIQTRDLGRAQ